MEQLLGYANRHLAPYKRPLYFGFVQRIPLTNTGKPLRSVASQQLQTLIKTGLSAKSMPH